jgi:hypothetical protein
MPLLKAEADKLSNNQLEAGVIEEIIERDDAFAVLPFVRVEGKAYVYNREDVGANNNVTLGAGKPTFLDVNDTIVEGATPFKEITTRLRILAGDVDVDSFLQETESDTNNQLTEQISAKAKGLGRLYHDAFMNGSNATNAKAFDGLKALTTNADSNAAQTISAGVNGGALTLTLLDQLLDTVPNGADAILMRRGTIRAFRNLLRSAGGTTPESLMMPQFGRPMLQHNGVPILMNEFIDGAEDKGTTTAGTTSVYAVRLNETDGIHGIYGGANAGVRVENVGIVQNKDARRYRLKWYAGLVLKSTKSLARLNGVTNV